MCYPLLERLTFFENFLAGRACEANQTSSKEEHSGGFGDWGTFTIRSKN
ncbi:hypothetical protein DESC_90058 [Desulfosarcina cetonica]|nr:hypothetical protein DESC_90058 [Desulfosarcina cetonica]